MSKHLYSFIFITLLGCISCVKEVQTGVVSDNTNESVLNQVCEPGVIEVEFDDETADRLEKFLKSGISLKSGVDDIDAMLESLGAVSVERVFPDAGEWEPRHRSMGLHRFYRIYYDENSTPVTKASSSFKDLPNVLNAEPVRVIKQMSDPIFNDPGFSSQWHYYNTGEGDKYRAGADVNVLPVWKEFTGGSKDVIVSVVDGGVDLNHEDLKGVVLPGGSDGSRNFYDNNYNIIADDHGTHVAGTIAAINNNGIGVCGVAGGLDGSGGVKIMSCQIFKPDAKGSGNSANAIIWGADHGAVISQNSWGYDFANETAAINGDIEGTVKRAVDYFIQYAGCDKAGNQLPDSPMKGGVVIFAAGNEGWRMGWPAAYEPIIAVGAMSSMGTPAYYTNYGDWVDIAAPGGDASLGPQVYSTYPNNSYYSIQGTSMACPHVSGVAALLVSHFGGPGFTNEMLKERLLKGANPDFITGNSTIKIGPLVDAYASFLYGTEFPPEKVESYDIEPLGGGAKLTWNVGADENGKPAYAYAAYVSKSRADLESLNPKNLPAGVKSFSFVVEGDAQKGDSMSGVATGLDFDSDYYLALVGYDYLRNFGEMSEIKSVHTLSNRAPEVRSLTPGPWKVKAVDRFSEKFKISDPDNHDLKTVTFLADDGMTTLTSELGKDGYYEVTFNALKEEVGVYSFGYKVVDAYDAETTTMFEVEILENHAPRLLKDIDDMLFEGKGESVSLMVAEYFEDPDGDDITFTVSHTNPRVVHVNPLGDKLQFTAYGFGLDELTLRAADPRGDYVQASFRVYVRNAESGASVYPSQVVDKLYVSAGVEAETQIEIYSSTGALVYSSTTTCSIFEPAEVDMSGFAPGIYTVKVVCNGDESKRTIVKL